MHTIPLHPQGAMPALGFGTWQLTGEGCVQSVSDALDIGYRHIDTAQIYENEAEVGKAIAGSGIARSELFVTTKIWTDKFRPEKLGPSLEQSLERLRMPYVDLLLLHWPNPAIPLKETLAALSETQKLGKGRAIGISNFPVKLMREAFEECSAPITCNQVEYHVLLSQKPVLEFARQHGIAITAYSPLARAKLAKHPVLERIGLKYGKTAGQVALRWLVQQQGVAAIPKAASRKHAEMNFQIFDFTLDESDIQDLNALTGNERQINPSFAPEWDAA